MNETDTRPHANCYWIEEGRFIAGEYPGRVEEAASRISVQRHLSRGITFFLDLTEKHQLSPYGQHLPEIHPESGKTIVYRRMPIRDVSIPESPEKMVAILDCIDRALAESHVVYLHCWGGVGRTGTVVGCHLVRKGRTGEGALLELAGFWRTVEKRHKRPESPETDSQKDYVRDWVEPRNLGGF